MKKYLIVTTVFVGCSLYGDSNSESCKKSPVYSSSRYANTGDCAGETFSKEEIYEIIDLGIEYREAIHNQKTSFLQQHLARSWNLGNYPSVVISEDDRVILEHHHTSIDPLRMLKLKMLNQLMENYETHYLAPVSRLPNNFISSEDVVEHNKNFHRNRNEFVALYADRHKGLQSVSPIIEPDILLENVKELARHIDPKDRQEVIFMAAYIAQEAADYTWSTVHSLEVSERSKAAQVIKGYQELAKYLRDTKHQKELLEKIDTTTSVILGYSKRTLAFIGLTAFAAGMYLNDTVTQLMRG